MTFYTPLPTLQSGQPSRPVSVSPPQPSLPFDPSSAASSAKDPPPMAAETLPAPGKEPAAAITLPAATCAAPVPMARKLSIFTTPAASALVSPPLSTTAMMPKLVIADSSEAADLTSLTLLLSFGIGTPATQTLLAQLIRMVNKDQRRVGTSWLRRPLHKREDLTWHDFTLTLRYYILLI